MFSGKPARAEHDALARSRKCTLATIAAAAALLVIGVTNAHADVTPTPYGGTTEITPGSHGDLTVGSTFTYSNANEDLRKVVVDTPAGGVGNPNAIPFNERCTKEQFETSICPASSQIGVVTLKVTATVGILPLPIDLTGTISIIQASPEVPTLVGAYIEPPNPPGGAPIRSYATFYPVTQGPDGDFRLRSVTSDFPRTASTPLGSLPIQVNKYEQKLFGRLANGNVFITAPTRCDTWMSYGYAQAYDSNNNADADPLMTGTNDFKKTAPVPTEPDCSTLAPFTTTIGASISSGARGGHPTFKTEVDLPGLGAEPQSAAVPKSIVATMPKALNVDVQQLMRICSEPQVAARACPANTKMGTVSVQTPMIVDGLQGEAYLAKSTSGTLPDLALIIHGAVNFTLRGTNHYVNGSQLQTTFDNIPQVGFSKFTLTIDGGPTGLLRVNTCPTSTKDPMDEGPISFALTSYQGQGKTSSSPLNFDGCYKVSVKKINKCVKSRLSLRPAYSSRSSIKYVRLYIDGRKVKTATRSPFRFSVKLSKRVKPGKRHKYKLLVFYKPTATNPKGKVIKKTGTFKRC